jgi:hypothetical protein
VATALFGPTSIHNGPKHEDNSTSKRPLPKNNITQLVMLFDQDWSYMEMEYQPEKAKSSSLFFPSEQTVIALWKRAANHPGETVQIEGLSCRLIISKETKIISAQTNLSMMSKRELLDYLQSNCSLEFLRRHHLNSTIDTLVRKCNKNKLIEIAQSCQQQNTPGKPNESTEHDVLESLLKQFIQPISNTISKVLVATLHESSDHELPVWDHVQESTAEAAANPRISSESLQVCLFLGAVRDMTLVETQCLDRAVNANHQEINKSHADCLMKVRLGPVPEFTSKILSIVSFHHYNGVLGPSLLRLERKPPSNEQLPGQCHENCLLHFICLVPLRSDELSSALEDRSRILWCLVRCTVASLWRSRLAGNQTELDVLKNKLTFVFLHDGVKLTLDQDDLVRDLASQHMAAPSEFQILKALQDKLASSTQKHKETKQTLSLEQIIDILGVADKLAPLCFVNFCCGTDEMDVTNHVYSKNASCTAASERKEHKSFSVLVLLSFTDSKDKDDTLKQIQETISQTARRNRIPVISGRKVLDIGRCSDWEASVIAMIQHLGYQRRLFPLLQVLIDGAFAKKKLESKKNKRRRSGD